MTTTSAIAGQFGLITFTTTDDFTLQPNTKYWLYVTINDGEAVGVQQTQSDDENVESNTDWAIGGPSYRTLDGGAWTEEDGENIQMSLSGHAAPAFLVSNLDSPGEDVLFRRETDVDGAKIAQSFRATDNTDGTPAEFDFHGITVLLESASPIATDTLTASDILVTVHSDHRRPAWRPHLYADLSGNLHGFLPRRSSHILGTTRKHPVIRHYLLGEIRNRTRFNVFHWNRTRRL